MDKGIRISVITVCFNSEKTISQTIESVLAQDYQEYEYILVDGGSTDRTLEIIKTYEPKFMGRMKYISEKDNGIYDAMNKGIRMTTGDLVGIVNSDDYLEPGCFQTLAEHWQPDVHYQVLYGMLRFVNQDGQELEIRMSNRRNMKTQMIYHPTTYISRTIYNELFMYDLQYRYSSDLDFLLKLDQVKDVQFIPIYQVLSNFRMGGASEQSKAHGESATVLYRHGIYSKTRWFIMKCASLLEKLVK